MPKVVVENAEVKCMFGENACGLKVQSTSNKTIEGNKIATIMDFAPGACISGFGKCNSPTHPVTLSTGVVGQPCVPLIVAPWSPGSSNSSITGLPVLLDNGKTMCAFAAGTLSISDPGQKLVESK